MGMKERGWMKCAEPKKMLKFLREASDRKHGCSPVLAVAASGT
jgi:hypothetical protein